MFIENKFEGWNAKKKKNWKVEGKLVYLKVNTRAFGNAVQTVFSKIQNTFC